MIRTVEERAMCQDEALHERTEKWYEVTRVQLFYGLRLEKVLMFLWYFVNTVCPNITTTNILRLAGTM